MQDLLLNILCLGELLSMIYLPSGLGLGILRENTTKADANTPISPCSRLQRREQDLAAFLHPDTLRWYGYYNGLQRFIQTGMMLESDNVITSQHISFIGLSTVEANPSSLKRI